MTTDITGFIIAEVASITDCNPGEIGPDTALIGPQACVSSRELVELLLAIEDFVVQQGGEFDWTSDSAMSAARSAFRTVATLAELVARSLAESA